MNIQIGDIIHNWKVLDFIYIPIKNKNYTSKYLKVECQLCKKSISITPTHLIVNNKRKQCKKCSFKNRLQYNDQSVGDIKLGYFNRIRRDAEVRNLEFKITQDFIWKLFERQLGECALSGEPIQFESTYKAGDRTASLDRIDSSKGYTEDNVQWVHKTINLMKQDYNQEEFIQKCRNIVEYANQGFNKYQRTKPLQF